MYIPIKSKFDPNDKGYFGAYGGMFVPEVLMPTLLELYQFYKQIRFCKDFWGEIDSLLKDYVGRESPLYFAKNISKDLNATIYLKREDLNHTGAHKINNTIVQALLAKKMGKKYLIAETGAGQHGVAVVTAASLLGLKCDIFMGEKDTKRQSDNVYKMKLLGAKVIPVQSGSKTLKDAMNAAIKSWVSRVEDAYYLIGSAAGPHPYPLIVRDAQSIIGFEAKKQILQIQGRLPHYVIACIGGGSNAIGIFNHFLQVDGVNCIGVEAAGEGLDTNKHGASLTKGAPGILHGQLSYVLQDKGQIQEAHSLSAGLDYPGVGPEHSFLKDNNIVKYDTITDQKAFEAFLYLSKKEGIIPAFESAHAIAYMLNANNELKNNIIIASLSGRGDKDIKQARNIADLNF